MNTRRVKTNLSFIIVAAVLLELISGLQFVYSRHLLEKELENRADSELRKKANILNNSRARFESVLSEHLWDMELYLAEPDSMYAIGEWILRYSPRVVCAGIAFKPYYYPEKGRLFEPYAFWKDGEIVFEQLGSEDHDYTEGEIYKYVMENNKEYWSRPYFDSLVTHRNLITYCIPFTGTQDRVNKRKGGHRNDTGKSEVVAMLGLDLETSFISDTLNSNNPYESSFVLLMNTEGDLIAGPDSSLATPRCVDYVQKMLRAANNGEVEIDSTLNEVQDENIHIKNHLKIKRMEFRDPDDNYLGYVFYCDLSNNWQLAIVCYDDEVFGPLYKMRKYVFLLMLLSLILLTFIIMRFVRNDIRLEQSEASKDRMDHELQLARGIQMQMLPVQGNGPCKTANGELGLDLSGTLIPAREVGGDLYDYFIRDENLFFCIGDVSGKGIPAAMFMSATVNLFRSAIRRLSSPKVIMEEMNAILSANNPGLTFVTAFIGKIHIPTGTMSYCNAGHVQPVLQRGNGNSAKEIITLDVVPNIPLGFDGSFRFVEQGIQLAQNDMLVLCTDGITEARNPAHQMLGTKRWQDIIACGGDLIASVRMFMSNAEQADDITLLTIRLLAHPQPLAWTMPNSADSWEKVKNGMQEMSLCAGFDQRTRRKMLLAMEEVFMNIVHYSGASEIRVSIGQAEGVSGLTVTLVDDGIPFDPTTQAETDVDKIVSERQVGGLGIVLVRQIMDDIHYRREENSNIFTMTKKL